MSTPENESRYTKSLIDKIRAKTRKKSISKNNEIEEGNQIEEETKLIPEKKEKQTKSEKRKLKRKEERKKKHSQKETSENNICRQYKDEEETWGDELTLTKEWPKKTGEKFI